MMQAQRFENLPVRIEQLEITVDGRSQTYGLLVPRAAPPRGDASAGRAAEAAGYPLILGLHYSSPTPGLSPYFGLGFAGQLVLPALQDLNAILLAPDAPAASWVDSASERLVLAVVAAVKKDWKVDARRTAISGFSMGGAGTWFFAQKHPGLFRAAIPIAAPPPAPDAKLPPSLPLYVIHSRRDEVVPFDAVERTVRTLEERGGTVTFAPVDEARHHDTPAYIDALHAAVPWLRRVWA